MLQDSELELLSLKIQQMRDILHLLQEQINSVDAEVAIRMRTLIEKNTELQWTTDPYSNDANFIANSY